MLRQRTYALISKSPLASSDVVTEESLLLQVDEINHLQGLHSQSQSSKRGFSARTWFILALAALTVLSFATRFYCISEGKNVTWDEAHFGKFASYYLRREFYTDVHPPLGKMLVGLAGFLNNYNGTYEFGSGTPYPDWVNYVGMRMFLASFGALAVPFAFMTAVAMHLSPPACALVAVCMLLDNGFIGISRLILLDSMLLFFTVTSTFGLALFNRYRDQPFTLKWWLSLAWTGLNIGLVSSVKWVGFFGVALVGLHTIRDLWHGLPVLPRRHFAKDFAARILFLIALPLAVYCASFYVHFLILNRSGPGDANMSSLFQAGLAGNEISRSPLEVAYGSQITLRNQGSGGGLIHSHVQTYPEGSKQQQVTGYHHKDLNNNFVIAPAHAIPVAVKKDGEAASAPSDNLPKEALPGDDTAGNPKDLEADEALPAAAKAADGSSNAEKAEEGQAVDAKGDEAKPEAADAAVATEEVVFLKDGDVIRLLHVATQKNLHSHRVHGHVSKKDFEVSGYGNNTAFKDPNDHWKVEVVSDLTPASLDHASGEKRVRALGTSFRLKHVVTGCYMSMNGANYPEWGFRQLEVSCHNVPLGSAPSAAHLLWNVETHVNDKLPPGEPGLYKSTFLRDFIDVNINMWRTNNALVPDSELEASKLTSSAYEWPLLWRGIRMTSFDDNTVKFYMGGNPLVWWLAAAAIFLGVCSLGVYALCQKRGLAFPLAPTDASLQLFRDQLQIGLLGWLLHIAPFFVMGRVLYLHHYYPALFFGILALAAFFDRFALKAYPHADAWKRSAFLAFLGLAIPIATAFYMFMPIAYGMHGPIDNYAHLRWLSEWL